MAGKSIVGLFDKLLGIVKERLVELECHILEQHIPLTIEEEQDDDFGRCGDEVDDQTEDSEDE
jgi:hypothetical protein